MIEKLIDEFYGYEKRAKKKAARRAFAICRRLLERYGKEIRRLSRPLRFRKTHLGDDSYEWVDKNDKPMRFGMEGFLYGCSKSRCEVLMERLGLTAEFVEGKDESTAPK